MSDNRTPGPWTVIKSRDVFSAVIVPGVRTVCFDIESDGDACLIAAAPQLLAACKALINAPHQEHFAARLNDEEMDALRMIEAAIAAATEWLADEALKRESEHVESD
jgi:hypothetical protein